MKIENKNETAFGMDVVGPLPAYKFVIFLFILSVFFVFDYP